MRDHCRIADKFDKRSGNLGKKRLIRQKRFRQAVHLEGPFGHVALRIDIAMEGLARGQMVDQLDTTDFDHAVPRLRA